MIEMGESKYADFVPIGAIDYGSSMSPVLYYQTKTHVFYSDKGSWGKTVGPSPASVSFCVVLACIVFRWLDGILGDSPYRHLPVIVCIVLACSAVASIGVTHRYWKRRSLVEYDVEHVSSDVIYSSTMRNAFIVLKFSVFFILLDIVLLLLYLYITSIALLIC